MPIARPSGEVYELVDEVAAFVSADPAGHAAAVYGRRRPLVGGHVPQPRPSRSGPDCPCGFARSNTWPAQYEKPRRWYADLTRYQWLVLVIASAGWIFDTFEGQLFNITRGDMLKELLGTSAAADRVKSSGDVLLAVFLLGGTLGGIGFGTLADRFGRRPVMALTILCYSIFSGLTYFATDLWQVGALRFLVALGVGGEWAVAAALVAEVFPTHARAHASGIFHATSVLGTWLAAIAGLMVNTEWR